MAVTKTELKKIKSLQTKKGRREHGRYLAEGTRLLEESLRHNLMPEAVYYLTEGLSGREKQLLAALEERRVPVFSVSQKQLDFASQTRSPQGLLGLFRLPESKPGELLNLDFRKLLLCEDISEPGNLGTLLRSALAFGFDQVLLCGTSADAYSPKVVRSSAGAIFGLQILKITLTELLSFVRDEKLLMIGTDINGHSDWKELTVRLKKERFILAVGSEAEGLSEQVRRHCEFLIRIDHESLVESLNAGVAGSIIMKQVYDLLK
ncbi:MAG: TrmH family RNA methyltransferase [Candidatus Zixiibacteriota bacterium]